MLPLPTVVHAEVLPALSTDRNWTVVVPSAETGADVPDAGADHAPPLRAVSYWYPASPERASVEPLPVMVAEAAFDQEVEPPETAGSDGAVRSRLTVLPAATVVQADMFPALSTDRKRTVVVPSAETGADAPDTAADHAPPLSAISYWYPATPREGVGRSAAGDGG